MNRRSWTSLLLVAAALAAPSLAATDESRLRLKPGAKGTTCLGCHETFKDTVKQPFVHTPVKSGACSDCHNPHASTHGKLLSDSVSQICRKCHEAIVPDGAKSIHKVVADGKCADCHDPHGAANKNNLRKAGNDVCNSCHQDVASAVAASTFKHAPVGRACTTCHDPHAGSQSERLLKKRQPALCLDCHSAAEPAFARQHMNYPVAKGQCTSCHDPHGSSQRGILWANVHQPVANKMCSQCHQDPSSAAALETKRTGVELCRTCHSGLVNETLATKRLHWPVADTRGCLNCHSPHAARQEKLLASPTLALCGSCHADTVARQVKSLTKHPPVQEGACSTCHAPHGSDNVYFLTFDDPIDLCGSCHDWQRHSTHPIGRNVVDPRNKNLTLDCSSCHRSHGSGFRYLATYDPKMDLCVQCHESFRR